MTPRAIFLFDILRRMSLPNVDQLIRSKRRTIAIIVRRDGAVVVRAPLKAPEAQIRRFVESKARWVNEKKAEAAKHAPKTARKFTTGEEFLFLGQKYPLRVIEGQKAGIRFEAAFILTKIALPNAKLIFEKWYRTAARKVLSERLQLYAKKFGLRYEKIRISSARTRWGSCSPKGTLSFTWRLVMAPPEVVDYVIVHELAHLKVKNHSKTFWAEVARMMPEYKRHVAWLRKNGKFLTLDGE
jgi:predicted metal-dependent hydrolase